MVDRGYVGDFVDSFENAYERNLVDILLSAVLDAGDRIVDIKDRTATTEGDQHVGHHAIVTPADIVSQRVALEHIKHCKHSFIIAEEDDPELASEMRRRILTPENYRDHLRKKLWVLDSICGSSGYQRHLYEWAVSLGFRNTSRYRLGAVYAPEVHDGLLVVSFKGGASKEHAAYLFEHDKRVVARGERIALPRLPYVQPRDAMIQFGVDIALNRNYNAFVNSVADMTRTTAVNGSCALSLALVAAGRVDALVQPPQRVWDWFGGQALVEAVGGKMQFYRIDKSRIKPLNRLTGAHYDPSKKEIGFIAGKPALVDQLFRELQRSYNGLV